MSAGISAKSWRRRIGLPLALVALASAWMLVGTSSAADPNDWGLTGSEFQTKDGNAEVETPASEFGARDWNNLNNYAGDGLSSTNPDTYTATIKADKETGSGDDSFGNGTKEDTPVPSVVSGSIPPNKSDLLEFGSWIETTSSGSFLHLFWSRVQEPSGTTNMDFELNAKACPPVVAPGAVQPSRANCSANGVTPVRTANDLLVTYDLERGGSTASIGLKKWNGTAWVGADLGANNALGSINGTATTSTLTGNTYSPRTFGEASINLTTIFNPNACTSLGSAYLKSRSSDSFTSAVKDFVAPTPVDITNCGRLVVHKRAGSATGAFLAGAGFTISPANRATPAVSTLSQVGSTDVGVFCIDSLWFGVEYTLHEEDVPSGYRRAADVLFTPTAANNAGTCSTVVAPSSSGAGTPPDVTVVNQLQTASIRISKTDDATVPLGGATFTAYRDVNPATGTNSTTVRGAEDSTAAGSCPTDSDGACTIASIPVGHYWVVETVTPSGYSTAADQRVDATTSGGTANVSFVNKRQFKIITLVCKVVDKTLYSSSVSYNGGTASNSLAAGSLSAADQASLCDLTGATVVVNKTTADHTSAITIP